MALRVALCMQTLTLGDTLHADATCTELEPQAQIAKHRNVFAHILEYCELPYH